VGETINGPKIVRLSIIISLVFLSVFIGLVYSDNYVTYVSNPLSQTVQEILPEANGGQDIVAYVSGILMGTDNTIGSLQNQDYPIRLIKFRVTILLFSESQILMAIPTLIPLKYWLTKEMADKNLLLKKGKRIH
jgi:hypothetical protein